jgi:hypothetical protein
MTDKNKYILNIDSKSIEIILGDITQLDKLIK